MYLPISQLSKIGAPFVWILSNSAIIVSRTLGIKDEKTPVTEEEIKSMIEEGKQGGEVKEVEQMKAEYREVISLLRKGYSIRDVAKLSGRGVSTVQRVKRLMKVQSTQ